MTNKSILEQLLVASSEQAINGTRRLVRSGRQRKYPWAEIQVGQSFVASCSFESARTMAYNNGVRYGMKFRVVQHPEIDSEGKLTGFVVEVARIR